MYTVGMWGRMQIMRGHSVHPSVEISVTISTTLCCWHNRAICYFITHKLILDMYKVLLEIRYYNFGVDQRQMRNEIDIL